MDKNVHFSVSKNQKQSKFSSFGDWRRNKQQDDGLLSIIWPQGWLVRPLFLARPQSIKWC